MTFTTSTPSLVLGPAPSAKASPAASSFIVAFLRRSALVLLGSVLLVSAAHAGRSCEPQKQSLKTIENSLALAEKTRAALQASGHQVVFLARMGQDLSKYGLRYSHLGLAYQTRDAQGASTWRVLHKLNDCGGSQSALYRQGLGEFFLDDVWRYEAAWVAPSPEVQTRLMALVQDPQRSVRMHHAPYSIVSYAWGTRYQQSNQWALETLAAAIEPASIDAAPDVAAARAKAQAWLTLKGYQPGVLKIGPLTRLGGRVTAANVAFDDHPNDKRFADRIETTTVDSVFEWLPRAGLSAPDQAPTVLKL